MQAACWLQSLLEVLSGQLVMPGECWQPAAQPGATVSMSVHMCVCICVYMYVCVCVYVCGNAAFAMPLSSTGYGSHEGVFGTISGCRQCYDA